MTEKDLRRMKRKDLLRLLIEEGEEAVRVQNDIERKNGEILSLNERVNELNGQIANLGEKMEQYDAIISEKDGKIKHTEQMMEQILLDNSMQMDKIMKKLNEKDNTIKKMQDELNEKDRQNWELTNNIISRMAI